MTEIIENKSSIDFLCHFSNVFAMVCTIKTGVKADFGFRPNTPLRQGIRQFVNWYKEYYQL